MITKEREAQNDHANSDKENDGDERPTAPKAPKGDEHNADATNQHSKTTVQFEHKAISVGVKLVSSVPGVLDDLPYETHTGEDPADWLLEKLIEYETKCTDFLFDEAKIRMTAVEHVLFAGATHCYICDGEFHEGNTKKGETKVRDHDHISGAYRGAAHSRCNLL